MWRGVRPSYEQLGLAPASMSALRLSTEPIWAAAQSMTGKSALRKSSSVEGGKVDSVRVVVFEGSVGSSGLVDSTMNSEAGTGSIGVD